MIAIKRPDSCPKEGEIEAFDKGWNAQELGMDRSTIEALSVHPARDWALLGYDIRDRLENGA